jgi:putative acetyltransferase
MSAPAVVIAAIRPDSSAAVTLVKELDADLLTRYPGHPVYGLTAADLDDPRTTFLVARIGGELAGCGALRELEPGVGEVKRMYVRVPWRGRGVGYRLLTALEGEARRRGLRAVRLETGTLQPEAIRLYESAGYRACPPFGDYLVSSLSRFFAKDLS